VYCPGFPSYVADNKEDALSNSQFSKCTVEPRFADDVGIITPSRANSNQSLQIKGSGRAIDRGFSSAPGVQIAMICFYEVMYDSATQTTVIGAGSISDNIYAVLGAQGVNVFGERVNRFTLGGGCLWLRDQYGLPIDNVLAYELVAPNGTVVTVKEETDTELFLFRYGSRNNYGIVTRFTLRTFPQNTFWVRLPSNYQ
ncbi:uncharacterized protein EV420DRAFT_1282592, partial [Desarmillaria tabescens]